MPAPTLRLVRLAPDPLGLYIRAGRIDQKDLLSFITSGAAAFTGVVFEAKRVGQQQELLSLVLDRGLESNSGRVRITNDQSDLQFLVEGYTPTHL